MLRAMPCHLLTMTARCYCTYFLPCVLMIETAGDHPPPDLIFGWLDIYLRPSWIFLPRNIITRFYHPPEQYLSQACHDMSVLGVLRQIVRLVGYASVI